jgi:hypothetical protein
MSEWQPISTAPKDEAVDFWITPLTVQDKHYTDSSGNPILMLDEPPRRHVGKYGTWSSLMKATHWMPQPKPPQLESTRSTTGESK